MQLDEIWLKERPVGGSVRVSVGLVGNRQHLGLRSSLAVMLGCKPVVQLNSRCRMAAVESLVLRTQLDCTDLNCTDQSCTDRHEHTVQCWLAES